MIFLQGHSISKLYISDFGGGCNYFVFLGTGSLEFTKSKSCKRCQEANSWVKIIPQIVQSQWNTCSKINLYIIKQLQARSHLIHNKDHKVSLHLILIKNC